MPACPSCNVELAKRTNQNGVLYVCTKCGGQAIGLGVLHKADIDDDFLKEVWESAQKQQDGKRACPHCAQPMAMVSGDIGGSWIPLEICIHCHIVWFDRDEMERLPYNPPPEPAKQISEKGRLALMQAELDANRDLYNNKNRLPESPSLRFLAMLGIPVEENRVRLDKTPIVTWSLVLVCVAIYLFGLGVTELSPRSLGFIPQYWYRYGGITLITSFFLHGGLLHLIFNMYFFVIFGDNVETYLGKIKFLALLFGGHCAGLLAHSLFNPLDPAPLIGASAGIMSIMAYYAFVFPNAKIVLLSIIYFRPYVLRLPVFFFLIIYIILEIRFAILSAVRYDSVAHLAHFGGLAIGIGAGIWNWFGGKDRKFKYDELQM